MAEKIETNKDFYKDFFQQESNFLWTQKKQQEKYMLSDNDIIEIQSKLPDKKYYEFAYHMFNQRQFTDLDKVWKNWKPWAVWNYPVYDLYRFNTIIIQNKKFIKNKRVVDLGCNLGYFSLFSLHCGAKFVKGIDVRDKKLPIAEFICKEAGYDNVDFEKVDFSITTGMHKALEDIETIICSGIIYHIQNHHQFFKNMTQSSASCIIIDNFEDNKYVGELYPHMHWKYENTAGVVNEMGAHDENNKKMLVGRPNQTWIDNTMNDLGWSRKKIEYYAPWLNDVSNTRVCSVFTR
tara:strand:- start:396 stop:1271 length:876 start_codon:yes stop_codon:yes gene_type:complete